MFDFSGRSDFGNVQTVNDSAAAFEVCFDEVGDELFELGLIGREGDVGLVIDGVSTGVFILGEIDDFVFVGGQAFIDVGSEVEFEDIVVVGVDQFGYNPGGDFPLGAGYGEDEFVFAFERDGELGDERDVVDKKVGSGFDFQGNLEGQAGFGGFGFGRRGGGSDVDAVDDDGDAGGHGGSLDFGGEVGVERSRVGGEGGLLGVGQVGTG